MNSVFSRLRLYFISILAMAVLAGCENKPVAFHGVDINGSSYGQNWTLTDQNGQKRQPGDFKGHLQLVYFGFTQCPEVCPAALQKMKSAYELIPEAVRASKPIDILFITVDPSTDTVALLKSYLQPFGSTVIGLTGTQEEVEKAAQDFKVYAQRAKQTAMFEHSGFIYALDSQGRARLLFAPETPAQEISEDLRRLIAEPS